MPEQLLENDFQTIWVDYYLAPRPLAGRSLRRSVLEAFLHIILVSRKGSALWFSGLVTLLDANANARKHTS